MAAGLVSGPCQLRGSRYVAAAVPYLVLVLERVFELLLQALDVVGQVLEGATLLKPNSTMVPGYFP